MLSTVGRLFHAVVDAVAEDVNERVLHLLQDPLVDFNLRAPDHKLGLFFLIAAEIPDQARERLRKRLEGQHQHLFGILQQIVHAPADAVMVA